jgi:hypothetical protein
MENTINDFAENVADVETLATTNSDFYLYASKSPDPEDEDDDEKGDDSKEVSEDDPPLDEDVVHSSLPPKSGGKPK